MTTTKITEADCSRLKAYLRRLMDLYPTLPVIRETVDDRDFREVVDEMSKICLEAQKQCIRVLREYHRDREEERPRLVASKRGPTEYAMKFKKEVKNESQNKGQDC